MKTLERNDINQSVERFKRVYEAVALIKGSGVLGYLDDGKLVRVVLYCDAKGWLRYRYENGHMVFVACGYQIPKFAPATCHIIPTESNGDILYIPFVVSVAKDRAIPRQVFSEYLSEHPEVKQIILYKGDSDRPTIYNRKEKVSGKE